MAEKTETSKIEWLYPDLLSEEGLIFLLQQNFISNANRQLESLQKEGLVELYNRYVLPLPQRKYRNNRRGIEMTRKQILLDKKLKRKIVNDDDDLSGKKKTRENGPSSGLVNHSSTSSSRLKPPPARGSSEKKVITLNSSTHAKGTVSELDGILIKVLNGTEVSSTKTNINSTEVTDKSSQHNKRPRSSSESENTEELPKDTSPSPAKKSIAKITWP